jgi:hypothetical protein
MKCPCEGCITKPICRHKPYAYTLKDCTLINEYIGEFTGVENRDQRLMRNFQRALEPTTWNYAMYPEYDDKYPLVIDLTEDFHYEY